MAGGKDMGHICYSANKSSFIGGDILLKTGQELVLPVAAAGYSLWDQNSSWIWGLMGITPGLGGNICNTHTLDSDLKNFLVPPLGGLARGWIVQSRLSWADGAGRHPCKISLWLSLLSHRVCGSSWPSCPPNLVGSLGPNTHG